MRRGLLVAIVCRLAVNERTIRCGTMNGQKRRNYRRRESDAFCSDSEGGREDRRSMDVTWTCQCSLREPNQTTRWPMKYFVIGRQKPSRRPTWSESRSFEHGRRRGYRRVRRRHEAVKSLSRSPRSNDQRNSLCVGRVWRCSSVTELRDGSGDDKRPTASIPVCHCATMAQALLPPCLTRRVP